MLFNRRCCSPSLIYLLEWTTTEEAWLLSLIGIANPSFLSVSTNTKGFSWSGSICARRRRNTWKSVRHAQGREEDISLLGVEKNSRVRVLRCLEFNFHLHTISNEQGRRLLTFILFFFVPSMCVSVLLFLLSFSVCLALLHRGKRKENLLNDREMKTMNLFFSSSASASSSSSSCFSPIFCLKKKRYPW